MAEDKLGTFRDEELKRLIDLIENEEPGTERYNAILSDYERITKMQLDQCKVDDEREETLAKIERDKPSWFDRALKVGGLLAPLATVFVMIWWDRKEDGGHIQSQYVNPTMHLGDKI